MKSKKYIILIIIILIIGILLLINYQTLNKVNFKLINLETINLNVNDSWKDPGYIVDDKYKNNVHVNNNVNFQKVGSYNVIYKLRIGLLSKKLKRTINVLESQKETNLKIVLNGENPTYLMTNNSYQEKGAMAIDTIDGNITNKLLTKNNIVNNVEGLYTVTYKVTNKQGVTKTIERKVYVYSFDFNGNLKTNDTSKDNEIIININDTNYSYTILPNNEKTTERNINYKINDNGQYVFYFYDKYNSIYKYEVKVTNIDKINPTGTCIMSLKDKGADITVTANDNNKIIGYKYSYGNNETSLITNNKYTINTQDIDAKVTIIDQVGNTSVINCVSVDNSTKYPRSYTLETFEYGGKKYQYWLYKPKNYSIRTKMPLLVYFHGDGGRKSAKDVNNYAFPNFIYTGMDFPFYMIAPYCNNETDFSSDKKMESIIKNIEYVVQNNNIDTDRIIISGGSSGARGAYRIASVYKNIFSCLVIGSGVTYQLRNFEKDLTYLPIWIFHGKNDTHINIKDVEAHVNNINSLGGNVHFSAIDGGHDITEEVFKSQELINWMIEQKRSKH